MKRFFPHLAALAAFLVVPLQHASAAGAAVTIATCNCSASYRKYHSGLEWVDFLRMGTGWSPGPCETTEYASWEHQFGTPLKYRTAGFFYWDQELLLEIGQEKAQCETSGSEFRKIARAALVAKCKRDSGLECDKITMNCVFRSK